jgi:hypothetical protein
MQIWITRINSQYDLRFATRKSVETHFKELWIHLVLSCHVLAYNIRIIPFGKAGGAGAVTCRPYVVSCVTDLKWYILGSWQW